VFGVVLLLVLGVLAWALSGEVEAKGGMDCGRDAWVIGVRGSGEDKNGKPGKTVQSFIDKLDVPAPDGELGSSGLFYPGVPVIDWVLRTGGPGVKKVQYDRSVESGVDALVNEVKRRGGTCADQKLVLAGYSQGAQVIREALPRLQAWAGHVKAVVLFGDPGFNPDSKAIKRGTYDNNRHGILGAAPEFPDSFVKRVITYCRDGDLICEGPPNRTTAHGKYAPEMTVGAAVSVADWLGFFPEPACAPASSVAAILDDSGSMQWNDPEAIRRSAMELLITKPSSQSKELGAVEFGEEAGTLFAPASVAAASATMLGGLNGLANDGAADGGGQTNYNAAFATSAVDQPGAQARIFLTDGGNTINPYEDGHRNGPPTYVIGLNIGPAGQGDEDADRLGRIAAETGGVYYPLAQYPGDATADQVARLQPTMNKIDAKLSCQKIAVQRQQQFGQVGDTGGRVSANFKGRKALEVVVSWPVLGVDLDLKTAVCRNAQGKVVADLAGKRKIKGTKRKRGKLVVNRVEGETFETVTIQRPRGGTKLVVTFTAVALATPTDANVQVRSVAPGAPAGTTTPGGSAGQGPAPGGGSGEPPAPPRRVITVDNRVTNGMGMREDSTPARLTTQPWTFCGSRGCNIYGTERSSGGTYDAAICQTTGERTTNGNDHDASDDANPERFESTRYYGVRLTDGTFGYVSEVWIRAADRGGLGLPGC